MATTGIFNGTDLNIYLGGEPIAHATSCEVSFSHSPREATTKDSGGDTDRLPGKRDWNMTAEALYANDYGSSKLGIIELFNALKAGTELTAVFKSATAGDKTFTGAVLITDLSVNAGTEENVSYSVSFSGNGAIVMA